MDFKTGDKSRFEAVVIVTGDLQLLRMLSNSRFLLPATVLTTIIPCGCGQVGGMPGERASSGSVPSLSSPPSRSPTIAGTAEAVPTVVLGTPNGAAADEGTKATSEMRVTDRWAVRLTAGTDPEAVAVAHHAVNLGPVGRLADTYVFRRPQETIPKTGPDPLATDPRVLWLERQVARQQFPRPPDENTLAPTQPAQPD